MQEWEEVKATTFVSLQLVDVSIKHSWDMTEDVLVKMDKFIFQINFIVLNHDIRIILNRPFLATS